MKWFVLAIALMGVIRFALTVSAVSDDTVRYFSMTAIIAAGSLYFAIASAAHKERLKAAYWLILPYMLIEVLALGYTWATGSQTIFHAQEYSFGVSIGLHTIGHFVGGLTWEPLSLFLLMEIVWYLYSGGRYLLKPKPVKVRAASATAASRQGR
jgi:hypothetical protein